MIERTRSTYITPNHWWPVYALIMLVSIVLGAGIATAPVETAIIFVTLCAIVALITLPVDTLPLLALCCFVLLPVNDLPMPSFFRGASLGVVVLIVWLWRRKQPKQSLPRSTLISASLLVCYLLATTAFTIEIARSLVWTSAFIASVLLPVFAGGFTDLEARRLIKGLIALGVGLSCFAIVEYLLHHNPIFGTLYTKGPFPVIEHWKTYRVTTTLGHPLYNAMFFAAAAAAAFPTYLDTRRTAYLGAFILTLIGLFLTGSRGALYLTPAVIVFVVIFQLRDRDKPVRSLGRIALLVAVGIAIAGALYAQTVGVRASSGEARSSTEARYRDIGVSLSTASHTHYLGSGPGTSNSAKDEGTESVNTSSLVIENSYLQILVSIGIPGLLLIIVFFGSIIREGVKRFQLPAVAALTSVVLVMSTFNFAEGDRPGLVLLGLLAGCCLAVNRQTRKYSATSSV
jgi:hypothetical protein